jgi:hypothetical protein
VPTVRRQVHGTCQNMGYARCVARCWRATARECVEAPYLEHGAAGVPHFPNIGEARVDRRGERSRPTVSAATDSDTSGHMLQPMSVTHVGHRCNRLSVTHDGYRWRPLAVTPVGLCGNHLSVTHVGYMA